MEYQKREKNLFKEGIFHFFLYEGLREFEMTQNFKEKVKGVFSESF